MAEVDGDGEEGCGGPTQHGNRYRLSQQKLTVSKDAHVANAVAVPITCDGQIAGLPERNRGVRRARGVGVALEKLTGRGPVEANCVRSQNRLPTGKTIVHHVACQSDLTHAVGVHDIDLRLVYYVPRTGKANPGSIG